MSEGETSKGDQQRETSKGASEGSIRGGQRILSLPFNVSEDVPQVPLVLKKDELRRRIIAGGE